MAGARALWRATGLRDADFKRPIIAIANSFTQFVPGHVHLHDYGQMMKKLIFVGVLVLAMSSLAWSLKAWCGLLVPVTPGWDARHEQEKRSLVRMEFKRFLASIIRLPCQIVRTGRRIIYRLMGWNPCFPAGTVPRASTSTSTHSPPLSGSSTIPSGAAFPPSRCLCSSGL